MKDILGFIGKKIIKFAHKDLYKQIKLGTFKDNADRMMKANGIDVIIDVGANRGEFAHDLIKSGFSGTILSFEPVPATFEKLSKTAAQFESWHCFKLALGEANSTATIHTHNEDVFSSILSPSDFGRTRYQTLKTSQNIEIEVRRLDAVLSDLIQNKTIDEKFCAFLKVDTQGYDLNVIHGASGFMDQIKMLQTEASIKAIYDGAPSYIDTLKVLQDLNFNPCAFNVVSREKSSGNIIEFDLLAQK